MIGFLIEIIKDELVKITTTYPDEVACLILFFILMINFYSNHNLTSKAYYAIKIRKNIINL